MQFGVGFLPDQENKNNLLTKSSLAPFPCAKPFLGFDTDRD